MGKIKGMSRSYKSRPTNTNKRYRPNRIVKTGGYSLSITTGGTVYCVFNGATRKLDSMFQRGVLLVSLPDETMVTIIQNEKGELVVKGEEKLPEVKK